MTPGTVISADGTRLAVHSAGPDGAPALVFVHGWAQFAGCWQAVIDRLSDRFLCVAFDLRGHGGSDKPETAEAYTRSTVWAADLEAVIGHFGLDRPVLVGWSYGARVIAAYLETHGSAHLGGVALAGGILAIGGARRDWMVGAESPGRNRDLYTEDVPRRLAATAAFVEACTARPLPRRTYAEMVGANMLCPARVRRALFAADADFGAAFAALACPGLVIHGGADIVVTPATGAAIAEAMPTSRHIVYDGIGHAPFVEDPDRFASDLALFAEDPP